MFKQKNFITHLCSIQVHKIIAFYTFLFGILAISEIDLIFNRIFEIELSNTGNIILEGNQPNQFLINQGLILVISIVIVLIKLILISITEQNFIKCQIYYEKYDNKNIKIDDMEKVYIIKLIK